MFIHSIEDDEMNNIDKVNECCKNPPTYALIQQLLQPQTIDDYDKKNYIYCIESRSSSIRTF